MAWLTKKCLRSLPDRSTMPPSQSGFNIYDNPVKIGMPTQQERRDSERVPCMRACPYELTKPAGDNAVKLSEGYGYSINMSVGGMLLLLPQEVGKRQVLEIRMPSEARKEQIIKVAEVCWAHPIPVGASDNMYLAGIRFLFEPPAPAE